MSESKIDYCDETWNVFIGCSACSPGCKGCYARREEDGRFRHLGRCRTPGNQHGDWTCKEELDQQREAGKPYFVRGPVYQGDKVLERPLHWRKGRTIFVCSRSDLYHEDIRFGQIDRVKAVMASCPQHQFLVLTKRAERMAEYHAEPERSALVWDAEALLPGYLDRELAGGLWPLPNVGLGVTVCNQEEADAKIPLLLACPAAMRFVSIEPLLSEINLADPGKVFVDRVDMDDYVKMGHHNSPQLALDFLIVGCESGKDRRRCEMDWVRSIVDQCKAASVPCFVKQLDIGGKVSHEMAEWPEDLRVRELPAVLARTGRQEGE